jgi:hypothetical protein
VAKYLKFGVSGHLVSLVLITRLPLWPNPTKEITWSKFWTLQRPLLVLNTQPSNQENGFQATQEQEV